MKGFGGLDRALSSSVHFVSADEIPGNLEIIITNLYDIGLRIGYVDYRKAQNSFEIVSVLANEIGLQHLPFNRRFFLLQFLDDMMGLSEQAAGVLILIDHANDWFLRSPREAFDFIETFLTQADSWLERKKPCHLLLQIEADDRVAVAFHRCKDKFKSV
jgi:hypothetical protein